MPQKKTRSQATRTSGSPGVPPSPASQPQAGSVAVIGLGNWGTALAYALAGMAPRLGFSLREVVVQNLAQAKTHLQASPRGGAPRLRLTDWATAQLDAEFLWLCVPDDAIASVCAQLVARRKAQAGSVGAQTRLLAGQVVLHASGACESSLLAEAQRAGAQIASVHPVMSFPSREPVSLAGMLYGVETRSKACRHKLDALLGALGGEPFAVVSGRKPLYHAAGTMASPLLLSALSAATEAAQRAGLSRKQAEQVVGRLATATLHNAQSKGVAASLSGPLARGDAGTVGLHLQALAEHPPLAGVYRALTSYALGALPVRRASQIAAGLREPIKSKQSRKK